MYPCPINNSPEVSGIGVRISVYLQAFVSVMSAAVRMWSDSPHSDLVAYIQNGAVLLLLGAAFVISGIIQATTIGLAAFDALLILNLNWIIITSVLTNVNGANSVFIYWRSPDFVPFDLEYDASSNQEPQEEAQKTWVHYVTPMVIAQTLHFTLTSAFGLWFFFRLDSFDSTQPSCTSSTTYFLGRTVTVVNGAFRRFWKGIYFIGVLPGINIGTFGAIILLVRGILNWLVAVVWVGTLFLLWLCGLIEDMEGDVPNNSPWSTDKIVGFIIEVTPPLAVIILLIVSTEETINVNLKEQDENRWSFGQTLPLLCSVTPIWQLVHALWKPLGFNKMSLGRPIHEMTSDPETMSPDPSAHEMSSDLEKINFDPSVHEVSSDPEKTNLDPSVHETCSDPEKINFDPSVREISSDPEKIALDPSVHEMTSDPEKISLHPSVHEIPIDPK